MIEIETLGQLKITVNGKPADGLRSHKARALLAYLAVEGGEHPRAALAALLWPESDQQHAGTSLRVALTALNRVCAGYLRCDRELIALDQSQPVHLDMQELREAAGRGEDEHALQLYGGPFLAGFDLPDCADFETWRTWQQESVLQVVTGCYHRAIERALAPDGGGEALELALRLLKLDPLDEAAHRAIMLVHTRRGNQAAAIEQYERCAEAVRSELGSEPSSQTRRLHERIRRGDPIQPDLPAFRPLAPPRKLPLVGRQMELEDLLERIQSGAQLVTLVGPGGIGKSRLAIEALRRASGAFPDGVFYCPLASVSSPDFLLPAIAQTLDFRFDSLATLLDPRSQLLDFLAARRILLLLDGFEHLVGAASWLADLLADAPGLTLLVTSRERLRLSQEWVVPLEGLQFAAPDSPGAERPPAIELFEQRMAQARGDRALDGGERQAVEDICAQLEGHPLAIELAAAWCASLSPSEVLGEMQASTDFLAARLHDIPEAHRSLRAVFERSWALLTPALREAFAALSVFRGSFEPNAAQAVSGAGWMELAALVDKSLVRRSPLGRYELHALLREYAGEALRQDAAAARRARAAHARHYLGLLRTAAPHLISAGMAPAREALARELPNLWLALEHAVGTFDDATLLDALNDLLAFYVAYGWHEGALAFERLAQLIREARPAAAAQPLFDRLYQSAAARQSWFLAHLGQAGESRALSQPLLEWAAGDPSPEDRSLCLNNLGICACLRGEFDEGIELLNQAIELGQGCAEPVFPSYHLWLGYIRFFQGRYHDSMADYQTCFDLFERQGNQLGMAFALSKMGLSADGMGSYDRGLAYHRQALDIFRATSHLSGQAYTYSRMSVDAYGLGDDRQAAEWAQAGLERFRTLSHRWGIGISRCRLAYAQIGLGCLQEARSNLMAALARAREHEMAPLMAYAILGLACVRQAEGDPELAAWLARAAAASPKTPPLYLELAARWLPGLAPPGPETARPAAPTFEATQPADPSPDLEQMAHWLLQEALPGPDPS